MVRRSWGDRLQIDGDHLRILEGAELKETIPFNAIQNVSRRFNVTVITWDANGKAQNQTLSGDGFDGDDWLEFNLFLRSRLATA